MWDWSAIGLWFVTSFVGAGLAKLIELGVNRYTQKQSRLETKINVLLKHIDDFGELAEYYRFFARVGSNIATDDEGNFQKDKTGRFVIENTILEPELRFRKAIKELKQTDIDAAIAQKIVTIRLESAQANDIATEVDPSGGLKKQLTELYIKTVWTIDTILDQTKSHNSMTAWDSIVKALEEATEFRRNLRAKVQSYLK